MGAFDKAATPLDNSPQTNGDGLSGSLLASVNYQVGVAGPWSPERLEPVREDVITSDKEPAAENLSVGPAPSHNF